MFNPIIEPKDAAKKRLKYQIDICLRKVNGQYFVVIET
ncbi:hypothetical protein B6N60_05279 [Richelia sinica FACHB-800]|uniref:Uncharacterized protein n=1 Tax=Richelia sinica FACHB-800 TaxID=1357546 RepID=A0A975TEG4_9NOST|nr:hypothetical protein B6N60_05279 [Richelia sinica FACHB-800]